MTRFEKVVGTLEKTQNGSTDDWHQKLEALNRENVKWRMDYEDINTKKLQEIHQAFKLMNSQMGKGSTDWKERCD